MKKTLLSLVSLIVIGLGISACGSDGATPTEGKGCANIGQMGCFDNVAHTCRLNNNGGKEWKALEDCTGSATANCKCVVLQGLMAQCTVAGVQDVNQTCSGKRY